jgi:TrmH family RNA methyltransferase
LFIKAYKKESETSYASGAYAVYELLRHRPGFVTEVYMHPSFSGGLKMAELCNANNIPVIKSEKAFRRINQKENCYAAGVFEKYRCNLSKARPHAVLVNPGDMGNLGSALRTLAGFRIKDIAIILPGADFWHPKAIRASMGAVFQSEVETFTSFDEYKSRFMGHTLFPFMLDGERSLSPGNVPQAYPYALVFGSEAAGLPPEFHGLGNSIRIPQSDAIDSLNISTAIGIGAYMFACGNGLL